MCLSREVSLLGLRRQTTSRTCGGCTIIRLLALRWELLLGVLLLLLLLVGVLSNGWLELIRGRLCRAIVRVVGILLARAESVVLIHCVCVIGRRVDVE